MHLTTQKILEVLPPKLFENKEWFPEFASLHSGQIQNPFSLPHCDLGADVTTIEASDVTNALIFGRLPNFAAYNNKSEQFSLFFPRGMSTDALFPNVSSSYIDDDTFGVSYESPCFIPKTKDVIESPNCNKPFVKPQRHAIGKENCINPCPINVCLTTPHFMLPTHAPLLHPPFFFSHPFHLFPLSKMSCRCTLNKNTSSCMPFPVFQHVWDSY